MSDRIAGRTMRSIEIQGIDAQTGTHTTYRCGCTQSDRTGHWRLCTYHQGYDDALDDE